MDRKVLRLISYGMYVVGSRQGARFNGQIANSVFQVTSEPPALAISINRQNLTHEYILESKKLSVSILSRETPLSFIGRFGFQSGREADKFSGINYQVGATGVPVVLDHAVGYLEVEVVDHLDVGTHTIFIGKLAGGETLSDQEPMTYAYYHQIKGGAFPQAAPTHDPEATAPGQPRMKKYRCTVCDYVYDPSKGDPDSGVPPGTAFEELPPQWVCPVCGVGKEAFEEISQG